MGGRRWTNEENEYLKNSWGNLKIFREALSFS